MNKKHVSQNLINIPMKVGREIVESGAVFSCPLLGTDKFVKYCSTRGLKIDRERLVRIEKLGLFSPIFRVRTPKKDAQLFNIPIRKNNNWFTKRWAYDTTAVPANHYVPDFKDLSFEAYYSIFQLSYLEFVLSGLTLEIHLDIMLDKAQTLTTAWDIRSDSWREGAEAFSDGLLSHEHRRAVSFLCQYISNRYYPHTQGDKRSIQIGNAHTSDQWISVNGRQWDWYEEVRGWKPQSVERLFDLTQEKLRRAYQELAVSQQLCDPIANWYPLRQFVSVDERRKLKGDALRAESVRSGALMLRYLHRDLYEEDLPDPNEVTGTVINHYPELEIRKDVRRHLELVANRFGVNPQPKLALILEGESERTAVTKIFEEYFGAHPSVYSIETIVLGGVDNATGNKKEDRFRAIFRLVDYLHHHQTITFLVLDNENYAKKLKAAAKTAKSTYSNRRFVTRFEYIRIWRDSFEFDNFSCTEIACAMNELAKGRANFTTGEVASCKNGPNSGSSLQGLYKAKTQYGLQKIELSELLVRNMLSPHSRRKVENRPIVRVMERISSLAARNHLPTLQSTWETNQASKYLGKKQNVGKLQPD